MGCCDSDLSLVEDGCISIDPSPVASHSALTLQTAANRAVWLDPEPRFIADEMVL